MKAPVATDYTHAFIGRNLPRPISRVLEVGCGDGALAARLVADGIDVVAIESDPHCVAAARAAGINAMEARWPIPVEGHFDAVLFTRSLHHISNLEEAIQAALSVLAPDGRIIVEDFRTEGASDRSSAWFLGLGRLLMASALLPGVDEATLAAFIHAGEHGHDLHSSTSLQAALAAHLHVQAFDAAYFFRYFERILPDASLARAIKDHELGLIEHGAIDPLGLRFVASRRPIS